MRRLATSTAAELLLDLEQPQETAPERPWCRLSEAEALVRLLYPGLRFRGITSRMWPLLEGRVLTQALPLPGLGVAWLDLEGGWWVWQP
jgi:hypothetical protein